jgi:transcriptional regulator
MEIKHMYRPRHFDIEDKLALFRVMRDNSFALLVSAGTGSLIASHIPLFLETDGDGPGRLLGHLARQNEQWQGFDGNVEAMAVFQGVHAYVSPSWYVSKVMVPTWNYVAVHAYGRPRVVADAAHTRAHLERLVATYESPATGPWSMDRLPDDYVQRMIKGIVAFEMPIARLEGKFKLSQNRSAADREGAIKGLEGSSDAIAKEVARLMREFAPAD